MVHPGGIRTRIAENAPMTNYAVLQALPRIAEAPPETGLLMESLISAIAQSSTDAKERMAEFVSGRAAKVQPTVQPTTTPTVQP